jgi:hypothetical protein
MTHPLEPSPAAAGSPVLPLQLLQPLDATHPFSTPASSGGPHQRLMVSPDPAAGAELDLRPTRLLISKEGQIRSIWPVHLAGWQQLGWQLHAPVETLGDDEQELEEEGLPAPQSSAPHSLDVQQPALQPPAPQSPSPGVATVPVPAAAASVAPAAGEAVLAGEVPNFQAMTKAEITAFCASTYGVSLDGAMTKAELVATATGLLQQSPPQEAEAQGAELPEAMAPPTPADQPPGEGLAAGGNDLGFQGDGADPEFPDDLL